MLAADMPAQVAERAGEARHRAAHATERHQRKPHRRDLGAHRRIAQTVNAALDRGEGRR
ncbi:MAG TPA: hypothetical protein VMB73_30590 [Acetobacteraceae bacterium]|nr:hypothetical protein [Acetobacteraceae bacterium]